MGVCRDAKRRLLTPNGGGKILPSRARVYARLVSCEDAARAHGDVGSWVDARRGVAWCAPGRQTHARAWDAKTLSEEDALSHEFDFLELADEGDAPVPGHALSSKRRQKIVAEETQHLEQVLQHPAFVADPFAALQEHLRNTIDGQKSKHESKLMQSTRATASESKCKIYIGTTRVRARASRAVRASAKAHASTRASTKARTTTSGKGERK